MNKEHVTADDQQLLTEIFETHEPDKLAERIFTYYDDGARADRTSRSQMYLHMGMLAGALMRVLDERPRARLRRRRTGKDLEAR